MKKRLFIFAFTAMLANAGVMADNVDSVGTQASMPVESALMTGDEPEKQQGAWSTSSTPALKFSEFFLDNWSKSGNSQIDVTATFFGNYKYTHPKYVWDNIADLAFGYAWQDLDDDSSEPFFETRRKSNDKIDLTSAISWNAYKGWGASFTANLKTQFADGFEYSGAGSSQIKKHVSGFFAPAYLTTALSFEYKKTDWSVSVSFLTGKTTFVYNDDLIDSGYTYGVIQDDDFYIDIDDGTGNMIQVLNPNRSYTHAYFGLGSYIKAQYLKKDLLPKFDLYARLELFYDYKKPKNMSWDDMSKSKYVSPLDDDGKPYETVEELEGYSWMKRRAFETDLDFELKVDYRFLDFLSANFTMNFKWDTDFNGVGRWGHWQVYQMAGVQIYFSHKTPKE